MVTTLKGKCISGGRSSGKVLATTEPISFWGGIDPQTGIILDPRHELFGQSITERVFVFPFSKGSSGASLVIFELSRIGKAPAAIVNLRTEPVLATGPIISALFYGKDIPIVNLDENSFNILKTDQFVEVNASQGEISIISY